MPKSDVPGELAFPTQPIPVKPPALARVAYRAADLVTAADTTPEHAQACAELVEKIGGVYNAGPFTPWRYRAEGAPPATTLGFPGGLGGANWGGTAFDPDSRFLFVATQDVGALGSIEKAKGRIAGALRKDHVRPEHVRRPNRRRELAVPETTMGSPDGHQHIDWRHSRGRFHSGSPNNFLSRSRTPGGRVLAGPIVTASGLVFIASTDDNRFRALDVKTGTELWVTRLERRGNADPITYQGRNGKQYVAVVATDSVLAYSLPD